MDSVRQEALRLYTGISAGTITDSPETRDALIGILKHVNNEAESSQIVADVLCEYGYPLMIAGKLNPIGFASIISENTVQLLLGVLVSFIQQMCYSFDCEYENYEIHPAILEYMTAIFANLNRTPVTQLRKQILSDPMIAHNVESLYVELLDLKCHQLNNLLSQNILAPSTLLLDVKMLTTCEDPEALSRVFTAAGYHLPLLPNLPVDYCVTYYLSMLNSIELGSALDGETVDNECASAFYGLVLQHIVRRLKFCPREVSQFDTESLMVLLIESYTQYRLSQISRVMTEPIDIGLLSLSENNTTDLSVFTCGFEALIDLTYEPVVQCINTYIHDQDFRNAMNNKIYEIAKLSGLFTEELTEQASRCLAMDCVSTICKTVQFYDLNLQAGLQAGGSLITAFNATVIELAELELPMIEGWARTFSLLSTLGFSDACYVHVISLMSQKWWTINNHQAQCQCLVVLGVMIQNLIGKLEADTEVFVEGAETTSSSHVLTSIDVIARTPALIGPFLSMLYTLNENTAEVYVHDWIVAMDAYLKKHHGDISAVTSFRLKKPTCADSD